MPVRIYPIIHYTLCILLPHEYEAYVCIYVRMYVVQRVGVVSSSTVQLVELSMGLDYNFSPKAMRESPQYLTQLLTKIPTRNQHDEALIMTTTPHYQHTEVNRTSTVQRFHPHNQSSCQDRILGP